MFSPSLEVVRNNLPQPAVIVVMIGDVLHEGRVVENLRRIKMHLLVNPSQKEVMDAGAQLQAQIWPLLWQNFTYR